MVRSMTGFGRGEASGESIAVTVELRSVNHRHLDVAVRLPRSLAALELDVRRLVQSRLERGRVDVVLLNCVAKRELLSNRFAGVAALQVCPAPYFVLALLSKMPHC